MPSPRDVNEIIGESKIANGEVHVAQTTKTSIVEDSLELCNSLQVGFQIVRG